MDTEEVRRSLQARLSALSARASKIESDLRDPGSKDWQERATESENEEVLERLGDADREEMSEIRSALARIEAGTYDVCSSCGGPIAAKRLEALPYASVCVECAA